MRPKSIGEHHIVFSSNPYITYIYINAEILFAFYIRIRSKLYVYTYILHFTLSIFIQKRQRPILYLREI